MAQSKFINTSMVKQILLIMEEIVKHELQPEVQLELAKAGYNDQRTLIKSVFCNKGDKGYGPGIIMKRLVVIDVLYSTNGYRTYLL